MGKVNEKPSKNTIKKLEKIKKKISVAHDYFRENREQFVKFRKFLYQSTITDDDRQAAEANDTPSISVNITEAYVSHFLGQLSMHEPSFNFKATTKNISPQQVKLVEGYVRFILSASECNEWQDGFRKEAITGGYSVARVYTDYINDGTFDQEIKIEKLFDPLLAGFDPLAREPHKGDAKFCYHFTPMTKEDFENTYPDIDIDDIDYSADKVNNSSVMWYESGDGMRDDILYVCDYYEKELVKVKLNLIADPYSQNPDEKLTLTDKELKELREEWDDPENPLGHLPFPDVIQKRTADSYKIMRYRMIGKTMLENPIETIFDFLPLVFLDGNSAFIDGKQITRSYFYNAIDCQRMKNFMANQMLNDIENQSRAKFALPEDAIPSNREYRSALQNMNTVNGALFYKHRDEDGNPIPGFQQLAPTPPNPQLAQLYAESSNTMQQLFGTYDAQLGIQKTDLSGKAIVEGSLQSSLTSMPFVSNYLATLSHIGRQITGLVPKIYTTYRTIPVITAKGGRHDLYINIKNEDDSFMKYSHNDIGVEISPGLNIEAQKRKANETMAQLAQAFPAFAAIMSQPGAIEVLIDNLDIRGKQELQEVAGQFIQEQEQMKKQAAENPPQDPNMALVEVEAKKTELENQSRMARIEVEEKKVVSNHIIDQEKIKQQQTELLLKTFQAMEEMRLNREKVETQKQKDMADIAIEAMQAKIEFLQGSIMEPVEAVSEQLSL